MAKPLVDLDNVEIAFVESMESAELATWCIGELDELCSDKDLAQLISTLLKRRKKAQLLVCNKLGCGVDD